MTAATLPPPTTFSTTIQRRSIGEDDQLLPYWREEMSVEEFLALPDDGIVREYINGHCYEFTQEYLMSLRNRRHCRAMTKAARHLEGWAETQGSPRGEVLTGDIGVQLRPDENVRVGIDVVYLTPEHSAATPLRARFVDGPPFLAVEIWSGSDTVELIYDRVQNLLDGGVPVVWALNPYLRNFEIYRSGEPIRTLNYTERVENEPYLPGFAVDVAAFFDK